MLRPHEVELVRQRVEREGAGLTVSVELPLSEGLRARSGLKGGDWRALGDCVLYSKEYLIAILQ